ncbi:MAG: hypothetical protein JWQ29_2422 [Phenylobacterium sp.]|nr:hypothetical protein [Phenylobacterium sp.]
MPNRDDYRGYGGRGPERSRQDQDRRDYGSGYDAEHGGYGRGQDYGPVADYAYRPEAGHEFEPDYLRWRDEQMRNHDRDYREWRRAQHERYDNDYRTFRGGRLEHFSQRFQSWRDSRNPVGGIADTTVTPGVSGYGDAVVTSGNESRLHRSYAAPHDPPASPRPADAAASGSEFGKEPTIVRAATDGKTTAEERKDEGRH